MTRLHGWLEIDTEGFAARQADRPPAHLVKEVIQNALDATEGLANGRVDVEIAPAAAGEPGAVRVAVQDNGPGVARPSDLRTVFCTSKTDSVRLRGRLGQGLKEILCLCREAHVASRTLRMRFLVADGARVCDVSHADDLPGTLVTLWLPWPTTVIPDLLRYCDTLLVPEGRRLTVNGRPIPFRPPARTLEATLRTECFADGRWRRRPHPGRVELVPLQGDETPALYELGIPVCPAEWTLPYHANVQQRVPMNPRRDAPEAGYLAALYAAVLPHLLPELEGEALRDEWVSLALERSPARVQREAVARAFGPGAVRSVPTAGGHDWDADAREHGFRPIDTSLLPRGLRAAARAALPSSREVELARRAEAARAASLPPPTLTPREARVTAWARWLAEAALGRPVAVTVVPELILHGRRCDAAWDTANARLLLSRQARALWRDPLGPATLGVLIHEIAHAQAPHHGDAFRRALEAAAGRAARVCLDRADEIRRRFGDLLTPAQRRA